MADDYGRIDKEFFDLKTKLLRFREEFGVELLERTRRRTPVDTGALRGGWGFFRKKEGIEIYNTMPYAAFVEYGTVHMAPRAMLRTSVEESEQIVEVVKQKLGMK